MSPAQVRKRVREIEEVQDDSERAHGAEDALYRDVLQAIAAGAEDARALAVAALKTGRLNFSRWTA